MYSINLKYPACLDENSSPQSDQFEVNQFECNISSNSITLVRDRSEANGINIIKFRYYVTAAN